MAPHWVNDLPATPAAVARRAPAQRALPRRDAGRRDAAEMRSAFVLADLERKGGVPTHVAFLLLSRRCRLPASGGGVCAADRRHGADRALPFRCMDALNHLRGMGESHATVHRSHADLETLTAAAAIYQELYGDLEDGSIPATFQLIYLTGWSPHESQQRPLERGSAALAERSQPARGWRTRSRTSQRARVAKFPPSGGDPDAGR